MHLSAPVRTAVSEVCGTRCRAQCDCLSPALFLSTGCRAGEAGHVPSYQAHSLLSCERALAQTVLVCCKCEHIVRSDWVSMARRVCRLLCLASAVLVFRCALFLAYLQGRSYGLSACPGAASAQTALHRRLLATIRSVFITWRMQVGCAPVFATRLSCVRFELDKRAPL